MKYLGCFMLALTSLTINAGNASIAMVGIEEMPESIKNLR